MSKNRSFFSQLRQPLPAHPLKTDVSRPSQSRGKRRRDRRLCLESLERRNLLAAVIAPVGADLVSEAGSYLEYGNPVGVHWYNGSGLSDATVVETGDPVPTVWPKHIAGNNSTRVSRIRNAPEVNTLTFDLGGPFDISGMVLWNSTEASQSDRGFENTILSYSTDGGSTFTGSDTLTWTQRSADESGNQGDTPTPPVAMYGPEVQLLPSTAVGVTHVRMDVDNFSGEAIVMASEIRFIGEESLQSSVVASLSVNTANGQYDLTQGKEAATTPIELTVSLDQPNATGATISFDLEDLGSGTATAGLDYAVLPANAKITVAAGQQTGTFFVNVIDDFLIEATETVHFRIFNPSNPSVAIDKATVATTIADNDNAGVTILGAENLEISEAGSTDTYTISLDSIPTGPVEITVAADAQTQISIDGVNFTSTQVLSLTDRTPRTITVRAINDSAIEGVHRGTITHAITGTIVDPNYPDVTLEDLYTQTGTDPSFQELIDSGELPTGFNSTAGITGSTIDVNNTAVEQGIDANTPIWQDLNIHTLANSVIPRSNFDRWTRWYQEDGNTQVFRVFEGEENVRNTRALAARIESFTGGWRTGVWNDFSARYTIIKPESMAIFQSFQTGVEWSVHIGMNADGSIKFTHRRANGGGSLSIPLAEDMIGKSFDVRIRENGFDYEVYFNGELKGRGQYEKPDNDFQFRWGSYRGASPMTRDSLIFVTGASIQANTSAPVGLVPYRPATTSLSIDSVTAQIIDNDEVQIEGGRGRGSDPISTSGWVGSYYVNGTPDATPDLVRHDALLDFDWGERSPLNSATDSDGFSARWEANLQSDHTATHQLIVRTAPEDALRVWVDEVMVIDAWAGAGASELTTDVPLVADQATSVRVEYQDLAEEARLWFGWTSPELPIEVVGPEWTPLSLAQRQAIDAVAPRGVLFEQMSYAASDYLDTGEVYRSAVAAGARTNSAVTAADASTHPAQRMRGYIVPEVNGDYQFRISGGDANRLLIADDGTPDLARVIASSNSPTTSGQWNVESGQTSAVISLVAGVHYYFEARQTSSQSYGGLSVQWLPSSSSVWEEVPSEMLRPLESEVGVRAIVSAVDETDNPATLSFDVWRSDDFGRDLLVNLDYGGAAIWGIDYSSAPRTVTIPAGQRSVRINLAVAEDGVDEALEAVQVTVAPSNEYDLTEPMRARTTLSIASMLTPTESSLIPADPLQIAHIDQTSGTAYASFSNRIANGENEGAVNGTVLVVDTITTPPTASTVAARWDIAQDIPESGSVYVEFYYRRLGQLWIPVVFELQDSLSFETWGTTPLTAKGFWQLAQIPITPGQALSSSSLRAALSFNLREEITEVEIANFQVKLADDANVPAQSYQNYAEREADNDWRWDAQQSVLEHRRSELVVQVTNTAGVPIPGATVEVNQLEHSFGFGNIIKSEYISPIYGQSTTPESLRHQAIASRLFNTITIANGLRWRLWDINDDIGRQSVQWVNDNVEYLHGHHLTWGQFRMIPDSVRDEYNRLFSEVSQTAAREYLRVAQLDHVADIASELGGTIDGTDHPKIAHWDTVNHPVLLKELWNILRNGGSLANPIGEVFDTAKANSHPDTLQMINEGQTIERVDIPRRTEYYDLIAELLANGKPVEAIGFMNHFDLVTAPSPTQFNAYLNEFAQLGLPLAMTEFDINSTGTDLQTQADWSEDYYLNVFANPATSFVIGYGFWESAHWRDEVGAHWYNADWEAKPNGEVFVDQIHREWQTNTIGSTRVDGSYRTMAFDGTQKVTVEIDGQSYEMIVEVDPSGGVANFVIDYAPQSAYQSTTVTDGTRILAELFDNGGQNVAYFDKSAGNTGGVDPFRADEDVDIYGSGNIVVGNITDGEWLEYTAEVVSGTYDIAVRVASPNDNAKSVRVLVGEDNATENFTELGTVTVPNTGSFGDWVELTIEDVDLSPWAGMDRAFRLEMVGGRFNLDWFEFTTPAAVPASIVGRGVAYRGATAAYGENAIDPTKSALRGSGAVASMANYTNYTQGLNRVVIDIDNLIATELSTSDFEFRVGNSEDFGDELAWTSMPPSSINVMPLSDSTKRVTIDWPNKAIVNQWLEVTVKANANTKLAQDDVFYFGNQIGDVDGSISLSNRVTVNAFDALDVRFNQSPSVNSVGIGHLYDVDRSGSVNAFDALDVRFNQMPSGGLMMITLPLTTLAASGVESQFLQNPINPMDVNGDGLVTALDALIGINLLGQVNASSTQLALGEQLSSPEHFYDVNGDGMVTALDSLIVINKLGSSSNQQAERVSIPLLDLESDRDDEFVWAEGEPIALEAAIDLALSDW